MPVPTLLTPVVGTGSSPATTAAFSPAASTEIMVGAIARRAGTGLVAPEIDDNAGGLPWVLLSTGAVDPGVGARCIQRVWRVNVGPSPPVNLTITIESTGACDGIMVTVIGVSGSGVDFSNIGLSQGADGDRTVVLPTSPEADSIALGFGGWTGNTVIDTPPANHTLLATESNGAASNLRVWVGYDPAPPSDTAVYDVSSTTRRSIVQLIEVKAGSASLESSITESMNLDLAFGQDLVAGRGHAMAPSLAMSFGGSIGADASPQRPAQTWLGATRSWRMPSGEESVVGDNLTFGP